MSKLAPTATATAVAKGVAKGVLYLNTGWRGNLAVAGAAHSDTALVCPVRGKFRGLSLTFTWARTSSLGSVC